jgi:hypothetical protein
MHSVGHCGSAALIWVRVTRFRFLVFAGLNERLAPCRRVGSKKEKNIMIPGTEYL